MACAFRDDKLITTLHINHPSVRHINEAAAPRYAEDGEGGSGRRCPFVLVATNRVFLDLPLVNGSYVVARVCDIGMGSTIMSAAATTKKKGRVQERPVRVHSKHSETYSTKYQILSDEGEGQKIQE